MIFKYYITLVLSLVLILSTNAQDSCRMDIGTNLHYFSAGIFKDLKKSSTKFYTLNSIFQQDCNDWDSFLIDSIAKDAQGYPLELPFLHPTTAVSQEVAFTVGGYDKNYTTGDYVMLFDGQGTFDFANWSDVSNIRVASGRISFHVDSVTTDGIHIIMETSMVGDHVRNIRIVQDKYEQNYLSDPFLPEFSEKAEKFACIRLMDWNFTNEHEISDWANRTKSDWHTQDVNNKGVAYEYFIELANKLNVDIWINVPLTADANYIRNMAALFRDQMTPTQNIYLELGNELWNRDFLNGNLLNAIGPFAGQPGKNYGYYSKILFSTWDSVFHNESDRVITVLAGHDYFTIDAMEYIVHSRNNSDLVDLVSYPGYIGLSNASYNELDVLGASATADDVIRLLYGSMAESIYWQQQFVDLVSKRYNKAFVMYEGGPGIVPEVPGTEPDYAPALYAANYHPEIYNFIDSMMTYYEQSLGVTLFNQYVLSSNQNSVWGSWGALDNLFVEEPYPPKYQVLMDHLDQCDFSSTESELNNEQYLKIFPNPADDEIYIATDIEFEGHLQILTLRGQIVQSFELNNIVDRVDISQLANGLYLLHLVGRDGMSMTQKLVIQ